ncbi:MAG: hypothetical protein V4510_04815 [bacterium]
MSVVEWPVVVAEPPPLEDSLLVGADEQPAIKTANANVAMRSIETSQDAGWALRTGTRANTGEPMAATAALTLIRDVYHDDIVTGLR